MKIAIASGKGGTGKTTVALGLALSLAEDGDSGSGQAHPPLLLDCDVEAPDAHLFLQPTINKTGSGHDPGPEDRPGSLQEIRRLRRGMQIQRFGRPGGMT